MGFVVLNDPRRLPWPTDLFDLTMLSIFLIAVGWSIEEFRQGRRRPAALLIGAFVYGLVLELAGMATHNSYTQGTFTVMLDWPLLPPFADSTRMPSYVLTFYPVFLLLAYQVVEALGLRSRLQAAVTGGLVTVLLDAPYIIQGVLPGMDWWTWHDFRFYELWLGWPLIDLWWHATWDALFIGLFLGAAPHLDAPGGTDGRWSDSTSLLGFPLAVAGAVLAAGPLLCLPPVIATLAGVRQWPLVLLLVVTYVLVVARALAGAAPGTVRPFTLICVGLYVAAFAAMVVADVVHDGGPGLSVLVQATGLAGLSFLTVRPLVMAARGAKGLAAI